MRNNFFKTKATTIFAFLQYLTGVGLTILLVYNVVPEENVDLVETLIIAVVVSALKDVGPWMYQEAKEQFHPTPQNNNCKTCNKPLN